MSFSEILGDCAKEVIFKEVEIMTSCGKNNYCKKLLDKDYVECLELLLESVVEKWLLETEQKLRRSCNESN